MLKIGVFTVMLPDLTPEDAARELKEVGYDGVEWRVTTVPAERRGETPSFWGNNLCTLAPTEADAQRARDICAANGLTIPGLGTYLAVGDLEATEAAMRFAQTCGARQIRVGSAQWQDGVSYADAFAATRRYLGQVQEMAQQFGVRGIIEIHHGLIGCSASLAFRLVDGFNPAHIGVLHDCGNMVHEGFENYRMGLELLGPYVAHVHVKNGAWKRPEGGGVWTSDWAPLNDGVVDFGALFAALRSVGYDGWVGVEDFSGARPTREALRWNLAFLKDVINHAYGA